MKQLSSEKIAQLFLAIAVLVAASQFQVTTERFAPQFIDQSQTQRTVALEDSSQVQSTNHFSAVPAPEDAIPGVPGKDQVNQWQAFVV